METTTTKQNGGSPTKPDDWESWLTASEVSRRLRCARTHVYRLAARGDLVSFDGYSHGKKEKRFQPASVAALTPTDEEVEDELAEEIESVGNVDTSKLVARLLTEARTLATESRKGQHEAYQLVAGPSRELHTITLNALKAQAERIRELEAQLNKMHDEQRDERREDREFALIEKNMGDSEARKERFFQMFATAAPELLGQVVASLKGGDSGPLAAWFKSRNPAEQLKLISAIEAVMTVEDELAATPAKKEAEAAE